nr:MAG TPA: hypothetical protein [Microviridae sp.]
MYKLYRYTVVYRSYNKNTPASSEFKLRSFYFLDYSSAQSEAVQIMRSPVPSFIKDKLIPKKSKGLEVKSVAYVVESLYVDDTTYTGLLQSKAIKGVVF